MVVIHMAERKSILTTIARAIVKYDLELINLITSYNVEFPLKLTTPFLFYALDIGCSV